MARKPKSTTDRAPEITETEAQNARTSDIFAERVDDLYDEAKLWFDGKFVITTEAEAEGVEKMLGLARLEWNEVDGARAMEKKPFDDAGKEVQNRYKPILIKAERIQDSCKALLRPWREKLAEEQRRQAAETARAAEETKRRADEAAKAARGDIGAMEIAEGVQEDAVRLAKAAQRQERDAGKGLRMRTVWNTQINDNMAVLKYYLKERPQAVLDLLQRLAEEDVRGGARVLPGCTITSTREPY